MINIQFKKNTLLYRFCHHADFEKVKSGHTCAGIISGKMDNGYNRRDTDRYANERRT